MELNDYVVSFTDKANGSFVIKPWTVDGPETPSACPATPGVPGVAPPSQPLPYPGGVSASTSLLLAGKGKFEYGEIFATNLVRMLEHFANACEPAYAIQGQVWFKNDSNQLRVCLRPSAATFETRWGNVFLNGINAYNLDVNNKRIVNLADAELDGDAVSKKYGDVRYVHIAGSTMTGPLTLNADPVYDSHAATKRYVDQKTATAAGNFVLRSGDHMTGSLNMGDNGITNIRDAIDPGDAVNLRSAHTLFVPQTSPGPNGTVMTGVYTIVHDGSVAPAALTVSGNNFQVTGGNINLTSGNLVIGLGNFTIQSASTIDLGSNRVRNVAQPVLRTDAATKEYVDNMVQQGAGGTGASGVRIIRHAFTTTAENPGPTFQLPHYLGFSYPIAENRLQVHVNGVKQFASTRGATYVSLLGCPSAASPTMLASDTIYYINVKVDESTSSEVAIRTPTHSPITVGDLVDVMKSTLTPLFPGIRVDIVQPYPSYVIIRLMSSLQGDGSIVEIAEPTTLPSLLKALEAVYASVDSGVSHGNTYGFFEGETQRNSGNTFINTFTLVDPVPVPIGTTIEAMVFA